MTHTWTSKTLAQAPAADGTKDLKQIENRLRFLIMIYERHRGLRPQDW